MEVCEYKKGTKTGLDCPCEECQKCRDLLFQGEIDGKINIVTTNPEGEGKWRR